MSVLKDSSRIQHSTVVLEFLYSREHGVKPASVSRSLMIALIRMHAICSAISHYITPPVIDVIRLLLADSLGQAADVPSTSLFDISR
jgi:hypothetical protein